MLSLTRLLVYSITLLLYKKMLFDHPSLSLKVAVNLSLYCEYYRWQPVDDKLLLHTYMLLTCPFSYFEKKETLRHINKMQAIVTSGTLEICKTFLNPVPFPITIGFLFWLYILFTSLGYPFSSFVLLTFIELHVFDHLQSSHFFTFIS